jgi:hypothetical protein
VVTIKLIRCFAFSLAVLLLSQTAQADDKGMGTGSDRDDDTGNSVNLSRDLVRLGIAPRNLPVDDPSFDARPLFEAAVQYVRTHHVERLTVDRGAYYFLTPQDSLTYLRFPSLSDLTVDLAGSKIVFAGAFLQGFTLANCDHVTLTNFDIDFLDPPYTQVELVSVDPAARTLSYRTLPNWRDPATFDSAPVPGQASASLVLWAVAFRHGDIMPGTSRMQVVQPITPGLLDLVQDNTPWTQSATLSTLEPGDTIVVTQRGGEPPILAFGGQSITISHGTVRGSSVIALILNGVSHSTADHVRVVPRPGALISANADGIHFVDAGPDNHIRHSFVTRTLDDALAIDALDPGTVVRQTGPRQIIVTRRAFMRFADGSDANFVDPVNAQEMPGGTIISQVPPDSGAPVFNGSVTLTFDRDLPALGPGFGMARADADARGAGSSIEDNVVAEVPFGRGVWIAGAEGVKVARNRVGPSSNGGIVVAQDTTFYPVPAARDIVIEDNVVDGSLGPMASGTGTQIAVGAIIVESTTNTNTFSKAMPNTNISILRNEVANSGRTGIWVGELDGGDIRDNVITRWDQHPELPIFGVNAQTRAQLLEDFTRPLVIHDSREVDVRDNVTSRRGDGDDDSRDEGGEGGRERR